MPRPISRRELIRKLQALGFSGPVSGGRHPFMEKGNLKVHIPNEHRTDISLGLVIRIIRRAGIDHETWDRG